MVLVSGGAGMGQQKGQAPYCRVIFTAAPNGLCISTVEKTCHISYVCCCGNDSEHCPLHKGGYLLYSVGGQMFSAILSLIVLVILDYILVN